VIKEFFSELADFEVEQRVKEFMEAADTDGDGKISFVEFITLMHKARHERHVSTFSELADKVQEHIFSSFE
jgi:hypothetical protein